MGIDPACQLVADILAFQLVAMSAGDNADALEIGIAAGFRFLMIFQRSSTASPTDTTS